MIHDFIGIGLAALLFSLAFLVVAIGIGFIKMLGDDE